MKSVTSIGGVPLLKQPTTFDIEKFNLTKSGRVASGRMKIELIAKKRKFLFSYDIISGTALESLLSVIDTDEMLFTIDYVENNVVKSAVVYVGSIKARQFRTDGIWYWKTVTFDLIEE
jgi:hypothetical protein